MLKPWAQYWRKLHLEGEIVSAGTGGNQTWDSNSRSQFRSVKLCVTRRIIHTAYTHIHMHCRFIGWSGNRYYHRSVSLARYLNWLYSQYREQKKEREKKRKKRKDGYLVITCLRMYANLRQYRLKETRHTARRPTARAQTRFSSLQSTSK